MQVRFWGTRGSLPVAATATTVQEKIAAALVAADGKRFASQADARHWLTEQMPFSVGGGYGGHSACVQIIAADDGDPIPDPTATDFLLCDAGSGLRAFSQHVSTVRAQRPARYHILMSHLHLDHIMGFPFFAPAQIPGNEIILYGCHDELESGFQQQQAPPFFPVRFDRFRADIRFVQLPVGGITSVAGFDVETIRQLHDGDSYGYRISRAGRTCIYSTDAEHKPEDVDDAERFVKFFANADAVVFDAMYTFADTVSIREDWGHASNVVGVDLCQRAGARHLVMTHHEPAHSDAEITQVLAETREYELLTRDNRPPLTISSAFDSMELRL